MDNATVTNNPDQKTINRNVLIKRFLPLIIIALTVLIIFVLMVSRSTPPKKPQVEKAWAVSTEVASRDLINPQLELLGSVESTYTSQLSAAITADVKHVPIREGAYVTKGQLLVELDDIEAQLDLQQKKANIEELAASITSENNRYKSDLAALKNEQALLEIAERSVGRQQKLEKSRLTSQEQIDTALNKRELQSLSVNNRQLSIADHTSRLQQLNAKLLRAQTEVSNAELNLSRTHVVAPYDGQIIQVNVSPGDRVRLGEHIVELYDSEQIEVRAQIPNRSVSLIRKALLNTKPDNKETLKASVTIYGQNIPFTLDRLSGKANSGAGGVDGLFKSLSENSPLIPGNSVKLIVDLPIIENTITTPLSALYGTNRIYTIKDERLVSMLVSVEGSYITKAGKQRLILKTNIAAGKSIVTTQLPNAINGLKVSVRGAPTNG